MADDLTLQDLPVADAVRELSRDGIVTSNPELESAVRSVTETAASRGITDLNVIYLDVDPGEQNKLMNYARQILDQTGGTVVARSPHEIAIASQDYPRAVLDQAQAHAMETGTNYPLSMERIFDSLSSYVVPWTFYSLAAGAVIIIAFVVLIAYWWTRPAAPHSEHATEIN